METLDEPAEDLPQQYCSFAVTGAQKSFQAIYVCQSCCTENNLLCLCQACADSCHAECDGLEYIGKERHVVIFLMELLFMTLVCDRPV
jgi:hypothetical protein